MPLPQTNLSTAVNQAATNLKGASREQLETQYGKTEIQSLFAPAREYSNTLLAILHDEPADTWPDLIMALLTLVMLIGIEAERSLTTPQ
jgi:hypothetical protein